MGISKAMRDRCVDILSTSQKQSSASAHGTRPIQPKHGPIAENRGDGIFPECGEFIVFYWPWAVFGGEQIRGFFSRWIHPFVGRGSSVQRK